MTPPLFPYIVKGLFLRRENSMSYRLIFLFEIVTWKEDRIMFLKNLQFDVQKTPPWIPYKVRGIFFEVENLQFHTRPKHPSQIVTKWRGSSVDQSPSLNLDNWIPDSKKVLNPISRRWYEPLRIRRRVGTQSGSKAGEIMLLGQEQCIGKQNWLDEKFVFRKFCAIWQYPNTPTKRGALSSSSERIFILHLALTTKNQELLLWFYKMHIRNQGIKTRVNVQ